MATAVTEAKGTFYSRSVRVKLPGWIIMYITSKQNLREAMNLVL